jgi:uncharacterized protein (DUF362 family)
LVHSVPDTAGNLNSVVFLARCDPPYGPTQRDSDSSVGRALRELWSAAGRDPENAFQEELATGKCAVIKPNWVYHDNGSGEGMDCLVTHASVLGAVLDLVLRAKPGRVVVGDAPIQGCDLPKLMVAAKYDELQRHYVSTGAPVEWHDFRRTVLENQEGVWNRQTELRPLEDYILFDLGVESLLEPISGDADRFRVTMYNPDLMRQAHAPGRHQYLVAREVIEADVVINLPKLKTHKKACITGALKNLVGINGNKDYLPHHRLGGSRTRGDCYAGGNPLKLAAEHLSDAANRWEGLAAHLLRQAVRGTYGLARLTGADNNLEGSWYGNDTIWRTCLDLNRILFYGRPDGSMAAVPQRSVLTLTDAIVCGEGEGPLAPTPRPLGLLTMATNPVAAEYVHAHLMGFDWRSVPLIREAFGQFKYPLCGFQPEDVDVQFEGHRFRQPWPSWNERPFVPPAGWKGHCEL